MKKVKLLHESVRCPGVSARVAIRHYCLNGKIKWEKDTWHHMVGAAGGFSIRCRTVWIWRNGKAVKKRECLVFPHDQIDDTYISYTKYPTEIKLLEFTKKKIKNGGRNEVVRKRANNNTR